MEFKYTNIKDKVALSRQEAAWMFSCSVPTIDRWTKRENDPLPSIHIGRKVLIRREQAEIWFARQEELQQ